MNFESETNKSRNVLRINEEVTIENSWQEIKAYITEVPKKGKNILHAKRKKDFERNFPIEKNWKANIITSARKFKLLIGK